MSNNVAEGVKQHTTIYQLLPPAGIAFSEVVYIRCAITNKFALHSLTHNIPSCQEGDSFELLLFAGLVLLNYQVVNDEVLAFHCVLAHILGEQFLYLVVLVQLDALETHVGADEVAELIG